MNSRIIIFNVIYYLIEILLLVQTKMDESSTLGYIYFLAIFWLIAFITLIVLLMRKVIKPQSFLDKVGVFTATPVVGVFLIWLFSFSNRVDIASSESYFNKNKYRYMVKEFDNDKKTGGKRIEYYRSKDTITSSGFPISSSWIKDSIWIYLSKSGDTIKQIKFREGIEVK